MLIDHTARAQAPAWQTALAMRSFLAPPMINATVTDTSGIVYLAGAFVGTATFGTFTLTSVGANPSAFVAKWHPTAGFVWAQQAGGSGETGATALAVQGTSVYVAGNFGGSFASFGAFTLPNSGPASTTDLFVAKLTDAGATSAWTWVQPAGGPFIEEALALTVNGPHVYVAGQFLSDTADFGATALVNSTGLSELFAAKLTDAGATSTWTWAQQTHTDGGAMAHGLAVRDSSVYVGGYFVGDTIRFGFTAVAQLNPQNSTGFVAKLTDAGATSAWTWAQPGGNIVRAVALGGGGGVYAAGLVQGDSTRFGATTLASSPDTTGQPSLDAFVAKLTDAGRTAGWRWAQSGGGADRDFATALAVSGRHVYVAGWFESPAATFSTTTLTNAGTPSPGTRNLGDVFVAAITDADTTGAWTWAQGAGGDSDDLALALAVGTKVVVGGICGSAAPRFGATTLSGVDGCGFLAFLADPLLSASTALPATLTLAPNPARHTTCLTGAAPHTSFTLLDELGRTVLSITADAVGEATFDVRGLPPGLYVVRGGGAAAQRLVVQ